MSISFVAEKMSEDINVCHKFMKEVAPYVGKFSKSRFVLIVYSVNDEVFQIKVSYCKHLIQEFVHEMIEELKKSNSFKHCWAVHRILFEETETPDEYFLHAVKISVKRE